MFLTLTCLKRSLNQYNETTKISVVFHKCKLRQNGSWKMHPPYNKTQLSTLKIELSQKLLFLSETSKYAFYINSTRAFFVSINLSDFQQSNMTVYDKIAKFITVL